MKKRVIWLKYTNKSNTNQNKQKSCQSTLLSSTQIKSIENSINKQILKTEDTLTGLRIHQSSEFYSHSKEVLYLGVAKYCFMHNDPLVSEMPKRLASIPLLTFVLRIFGCVCFYFVRVFRFLLYSYK